MAALKKLGLLSTKLLRRNPINICIRKYEDYEIHKMYEDKALSLIHPSVKKWFPGKRPETEEEHRKAAEKYGMHWSEYKPYPDDETCLGDYPQLPMKGVECRDIHYPWDFPGQRRNYGEPLHYVEEFMGEDGFGYGVRTEVDYYKASAIFIVSFFTLLYLATTVTNTKPLYSPNQYPYRGQVHYTFPDLE